MKWIKLGDKNRKTSETDYNTRSSRSHAIILIRLTCTDLIDGSSVTSTLSLCDLAGSEKITAQQERRKEGAFINKSLLALSTVISKLSAESQTQNKKTSPNGSVSENNNTNHIPYRDSKLTRILQPALSGNSIVTTICTVDTKYEASTETLNTLRFASRAKNVSLHVTKKHTFSFMESNEEKDKIIKSLMQQLEKQKSFVANMGDNGFSLPRPASPYFGDQLPLRGLERNNTYNDPNIALIHSENKLLKFKLENCENLLDMDTVGLQDNGLVKIVEMLSVEVGIMLETKLQGLEYRIRQYKSYTDDLENRLVPLYLVHI